MNECFGIAATPVVAPGCAPDCDFTMIVHTSAPKMGERCSSHSVHKVILYQSIYQSNGVPSGANNNHPYPSPNARLPCTEPGGFFKSDPFEMADRTHLHRAAQRGDIGAVRALVQAVDVNLRGGWRVESPLHAASRAGRSDVIACLVGAGAHTEVRDRNNDTPLLLAAWLGHSEAIAKLLNSGARVDADGIPRSALHCACMQGHAGCVSELLRGGADETVEDEDGNTPAQVIGTMSESLERPEDVALIHEMLRRAPADRAWRRRGWLVLLRNRDCIAAGLLAASTKTNAVTTRSAARRGAGVSDASGRSRFLAGSVPQAPLEGQQRSTDRARQPKKRFVGTRGNRTGRQVVAGGGGRLCGDRKTPPEQSLAALGSVCVVSPQAKGKSPGKKGGRGATKGRRRRGARVVVDSEDDVRSRQALVDLVSRLIGLGEDGAFRCVLSFL